MGILKNIKKALAKKKLEADPEAIYNCPVCGATNIHMVPLARYYFDHWQKNHTVHNPFFFETMNLAYYECGHCFAPDRTRLYTLYVRDFLNRQNKKMKFLDIAPDTQLRDIIRKYEKVEYRSMDLVKTDVDDNLDITNMHLYEDEQFDFFICSHVLEHIPDDVKAMSELYRVLKKGGKGIVMVPIALDLEETMEDPAFTDEGLRWKYFIQSDHVRMYAKADFISRLQKTGFAVEQLDQAYFTEKVFAQHAIFPTSVLYIVNK